MLRFAPSPTGDMHIGNLRIAIFNSLLSQQKSEPLIVRIEDSDKERNIEGKDQEILDILGLFGIEHKELIYQSNYLKYHRTMALQLLHDKKAFSCFCTPETLKAKREAAQASKKEYRYDGTCQNLTADRVIDNTNPFVVRLKKQDNALHVKDIIKGEQSFEADDIDSVIIMHHDKSSTYNFACAIDDMISDISTVIQGDDHISDTPKQIAIRHALGYDKEIAYAHLPMILNDEGEKMGKRDKIFRVKWMLEEGFLPSAIANYLVLIGNKVPKEIFTMQEALAWFSLENISNTPARFDIDKLRAINKEHLRMLDAKELSRYVGFADEDIGEMTKIYLDEASTLKELRAKIEPIFAPKEIPEIWAKRAQTIRKVINSAPHFEAFDSFMSHLMKESGLEGELLLEPLRLLLTGAKHGPEVSELYPYLKNYLGEIIK
ncbi:MAG: glutamate--tRNA ligase [Campylobacterota bacterium]|nr:glutamate--tRNA ligase [Campylobacterota bacterium]